MIYNIWMIRKNKRCRAIICNERYNLRLWYKCIELPFSMLKQNVKYSMKFAILEETNYSTYSITGDAMSLYQYLSQMSKNADEVTITFYNGIRKFNWYISRECYEVEECTAILCNRKVSTKMWHESLKSPFYFLDEELIYSMSLVVPCENEEYRYSMTGNKKDLYAYFNKKLDEAKKINVTFIKGDEKQVWCVRKIN